LRQCTKQPQLCVPLLQTCTQLLVLLLNGSQLLLHGSHLLLQLLSPTQLLQLCLLPLLQLLLLCLLPLNEHSLLFLLLVLQPLQWRLWATLPCSHCLLHLCSRLWRHHQPQVRLVQGGTGPCQPCTSWALCRSHT